MSKHTPGPWHKEEIGDLVSIIGPDGLCVAFSVTSDGDVPLIAAAPDLLVMLKEVERTLTDSPHFNPWDLGPGKLLTAVRATLCKVKEVSK